MVVFNSGRNRRGDLRGINGLNAVRGPNGRFQRSNPVETVDTSDAAVPHDHDMVVFDSGSAALVPAANDVPVVPVVPVVDPILLKVQSANGIASLFELDYPRLTSEDVLQAINNNKVLRSKTIPKNKKLYCAYMVKQCAIDKRDLGPLPYVVGLDNAFNAMDGFVTKDAVSNIEIKTVSSTDGGVLEAAAKIFTQRNLITGTPAQIREDMRILSTSPYKLIGAWHDGDNAILGASVYRGFLTNTGQRFIQIELLASRSDVAPGVGSALMRVLRKLAQVSPLHVGHLGAFTLRTPIAHRFYERKLPERNGPHARSFLVSVACIDEHTSMYTHLDMRYCVVFPSYSS
jgi:hypothetical protein